MRALVSRHLENFLVLYAARNMHLAAERKGISQPALTKSLKLLEAEVGIELFSRTPRGLDPTEAGHRLYRYANTIEQQARFAALDVADSALGVGSSLRIGVGPVLATSIFPTILAEFHLRYPKVEVSVDTAISNRLVDALERDDLDLIAAARIEGQLDDKYVSFPLFRSDMIVICRKEHPLAHRDMVSVSELADYERIGFSEDYEFEKKSTRTLGARAHNMRPLLQTTSMSVMFGILSATDHYAIVSSVMLGRAQNDGLIKLPIETPLWEIEIELMCKRTLGSSRLVAEFRTLFDTLTV